MTHHVYHLACPETGKLLYVGRGVNPNQRKKAFERKKGRATVFALIRKYPSLELAQAAELRAIAELKPPHNKILASSPSSLGCQLSQETRARMSSAKKGKPGYWTGKKMSEEQKLRLSAAHQGLRPSKETRTKQSLVKMGHPVSPETRAKIAATLRARAAQEKAIQEETK